MHDNSSPTLEIFQSGHTRLEVKVSLDGSTVWLTRHQLAALYGRDIKTIGKHVNNALKEELDNSVAAKFATTATDGKVYQVEHYNLDMILSVGYRVKSHMGIQFRKWANSVLRQYITQGYALNHTRLEQLNAAVRIMRRVENELDSSQILDIIGTYTSAITLLDDYDHQRLLKPEGNPGGLKLEYRECRHLIYSMREQTKSDLFGVEKDNSFKAAIGDIYQSFEGKDLYPSLAQYTASFFDYPCQNSLTGTASLGQQATAFLPDQKQTAGRKIPRRSANIAEPSTPHSTQKLKRTKPFTPCAV